MYWKILFTYACTSLLYENDISSYTSDNQNEVLLIINKTQHTSDKT